MPDQLTDLRDSLSQSLDALLKERDTADTQGDTAKVAAAQAEAEKLGTLLANVQFAIDNQLALTISAVAARLQDSIEKQRAIGLSTAATMLENVVDRIRPSGGQPSSGPSGGGQPPPAPSGGLHAKPGRHQAIIDALITGAGSVNLDPMMVLTIVSIESDFDPVATNRITSAAGLFQFINSTWASAGGQTFPGRGGPGNGQAAGASVADQIRIGCRFVAETAASVGARLGSASPTAVYMAHQQGLGGAMKILTADRSASIESVIGVDAARNNALGGLTVAQAIAKFDTLVRSHEDDARALVVTTGASGPTSTGPVSSGGGAAAPSPVGSFADKAVHIALSEMEMFARHNGAIVTETQQPLARRVLEYFTRVGRSDITDPSAEPWSAAFISFVMSTAGAAPTQFPTSASHHRYILAGLANRIKNNLAASIVYFDRNEMAPRVGDLVGASRTADVKTRSDIERFLPDKFFPSHTDLVIDVSSGKIKVIGGNVSQTILTRTVKTDAGGKIDPVDEHFFVLRIDI